MSLKINRLLISAFRPIAELAGWKGQAKSWGPNLCELAAADHAALEEMMNEVVNYQL